MTLAAGWIIVKIGTEKKLKQSVIGVIAGVLVFAECFRYSRTLSDRILSTTSNSVTARLKNT
jgi:hypothetical protein